MEVTIKPIHIEEKFTLSNMLNDYLDDLSKYTSESFSKPYKFLNSYFSEENRRPFFILADNKVVGFALVNLKDPLSNSQKQAISEFYILPEYRRKGIGEKAAEQIFTLLPGTWVIRELKGNPSIKFWKKIIEKYTQGNYLEYEQNDEIRERSVQEFTNTK